jgi:hypothetical protein
MKKLLKILVSVLILFLLISSFTPVTFAGNVQPNDQIWYTVTVTKSSTVHFDVESYNPITHNTAYQGWTASVWVKIDYRWNWVTGQWQWVSLYYYVSGGPDNPFSGYSPIGSVDIGWTATGYAGSTYRSANGRYVPFDGLHYYDIGTYHCVWNWGCNYPYPYQASATMYATVYYNGGRTTTVGLSVST